LSLAGFVRNDAQGVLLEVEGAAARTFVDLLPRALPPLARIEALEVEDIAPQGAQDFAILDSLGGQSRTRIIPDVAVCDACLDDMFDPQSRFHLYPFTSCTHCGPRFTLTRALPYDRAQTSMAEFPMCAACRRDYTDPAERRFHAEPIACPRCGPQLSHSLAEIVAAIRQGAIVALKGIGGFHLICDARSDAAVARLRQRKAREAKPFAVMVANAASAALIAEAGDLERRLLRDRARPIVLMRARPGLAPSVAPSLGEVGVMLPYAPLHHLLFHAAAGAPDHYDREEASDFVIVATSANRSGEPLCIGNGEAQETLAGIADIVVTHDRAILARADDSLVRVIDKAPVVLRR
jgi:hydrogenase maturation protein HypF